jgi:hypothetical protein
MGPTFLLGTPTMRMGRLVVPILRLPTVWLSSLFRRRPELRMSPRHCAESISLPEYSAYICRSERADERTRTADLESPATSLNQRPLIRKSVYANRLSCGYFRSSLTPPCLVDPPLFQSGCSKRAGKRIPALSSYPQKIALLQVFSKWAMLGSNQRPPPCKFRISHYVPYWHVREFGRFAVFLPALYIYCVRCLLNRNVLVAVRLQYIHDKQFGLVQELHNAPSENRTCEEKVRRPTPYAA